MIESISKGVSSCVVYKGSDLLSRIPIEISVNIFGFLLYDENHKCARTSKHVYSVVESRDRWEMERLKHFPVVGILLKHSSLTQYNPVSKNAGLRKILFELKQIKDSFQIGGSSRSSDFSGNRESYWKYKLRNTCPFIIEKSLKNNVEIPLNQSNKSLILLFLIYSIAKDPCLLEIFKASPLEEGIIECIENGAKNVFIHAVTLGCVNAVTQKKISQLEKVVFFVRSTQIHHLLYNIILNESAEVTQKVLEVWASMNRELKITNSVTDFIDIFDYKQNVDKKHLHVLFDSKFFIDLDYVILYAAYRDDYQLNVLIEVMTIHMVSGAMHREWGIYLLNRFIENFFRFEDYKNLKKQIEMIFNSSMPFSQQRLSQCIDLFDRYNANNKFDEIIQKEFVEIINQKIKQLDSVSELPRTAAIIEQESAAAASSIQEFPIGVDVQQRFPLTGEALDLIVRLDVADLVHASSDVD